MVCEAGAIEQPRRIQHPGGGHQGGLGDNKGKGKGGKGKRIIYNISGHSFTEAVSVMSIRCYHFFSVLKHILAIAIAIFSN